MDIDENAIVELQQRIDALPAQPRTKPAAAIAKLLPSIDAARARGLSINDILPLLRANGVTLSAKTVRDYMSRARRAGGTRAPARPQLVPAPAAPPTPEEGSREEAPAQCSSGSKPGSFELLPDTTNL